MLRPEEMLLAICVGGVLVVGLVVVGAGALDGALVANGAAWPAHGDVLKTVVGVLRHPNDPAAAYLGARRRPGGAAGFWLCAAGVLVMLGVFVLGLRAAVLVSWRRRPGRHLEDRSTAVRTSPWASRRVVTNAMSARAAAERDRSDGTVAPFRVGRAYGQGVYLAYEDSILVQAPSRSGKTLSVVIPQILDAAGPVVTLGTRADALVASAPHRGRVGRIWLWDPQGLGPDIGTPVRWALSDGCDRPETARMRATALAFGRMSGVENANFWTERAVTVLEALLHACALSGHDTALLRRWGASPSAARAAVTVLQAAPGAALGWDESLQGILTAEPRQRDSVWSGVSEALKPLSLPSVASLVVHDPIQGFSVEEFLAGPNTLYVLGTASGAVSARPIITALVDGIAETARLTAAAKASGRMTPPLSLVLDEVAKLCPFPSLPELLADGGGSGIATTVVIQAPSQLETAWSRSEAAEMWANASAKIVLGGATERDDLEALSRLIGEWEIEERSETHSSDGQITTHVDRRREPIASPDMIRELPRGEGILLYRNLPPIRITLDMWHRRKDAGPMRENEAALRARMVSERAG